MHRLRVPPSGRRTRRRHAVEETPNTLFTYFRFTSTSTTPQPLVTTDEVAVEVRTYSVALTPCARVHYYYYIYTLLSLVPLLLVRCVYDVWLAS